jgi:hypothetical protein
MEELRALKQKGNGQYKEGSFQASCVTYGEVMNRMMAIEGQKGDDGNGAFLQDDETQAEFNGYKSTVFGNIAAANLKIGEYEAVRRCCNASIVFLNEPTLPLLDLGLEERDGDNILDNTPLKLKEPVSPAVRSFAAKMLYRRAYALNAMTNSEESLEVILGSLEQAQALVTVATCSSSGNGKSAPQVDTGIPILLAEVQRRLTELRAVGSNSGDGGVNDAKSTESDALYTVRFHPEKEGMVVNGGPCLLRRGFWSQTVQTATAYLPLSHFVCTPEDLSSKKLRDTADGDDDDDGDDGDGGSVVVVKPGVSGKDLTVCIEKEGVTVGAAAGSGPRSGYHHYLAFEYWVQPSSCTWQLERVCKHDNGNVNGNGNDNGNSKCPDHTHLVLHLSKSPSAEWFPGCEWWSHVFLGDEAIDTTTCTVGTDGTELAPEAHARAEQENRRFMDLSDKAQAEELLGLRKLKQDTDKAVTAHELAERAALEEEPGRRDLLAALSAQLPNVYCGAQARGGEVG